MKVGLVEVSIVNGDFTCEFGNTLLIDSSLAGIKKQVAQRWKKSVGKSYTVKHHDEAGNLVADVYRPALVRVSSKVLVPAVNKQLELFV
jgi:hypothetical protein